MNKDNLVPAGVCAGILVAIVSAAWAVVYAERTLCESRAEVMGVRHMWGPRIGCMIEYKPGRWILMDRYRGAD